MLICFHCGLDYSIKSYVFDDKNFCCNGCKTVYEILNSNDLNSYYTIESFPGNIPNSNNSKFDYLQEESIVEKLLVFKNDETSIAEFHIPGIHCSSCIWVLENLDKLEAAIVSSTVHFTNKTVRIIFNNKNTNLKKVVILLASIGYEPYISLDDAEGNNVSSDKTLLYQLAIAAFGFGNIMLLSFPEYFGVEDLWLEKYKHLFRWLMFVMSVPVVFYAAKDYFISAYKGLRYNILNIDVPIVLGISVLFMRSSYEIAFDLGSGFFDSLTGFIFFLLLGKYFQQKTYVFLSFERDFKSYFPIAVTLISNDGEKNKPVQDVEKGDRLLIRNDELIPVDGILISNNAAIDYSFVTGESLPVLKQSGDKLFAGGKQTSGSIEMEAVKSMSGSYLTQLWANEIFDKKEEISIKNTTNAISKYFTVAILAIALVAGVYWYLVDTSKTFNVVTAVLIIACPCALALSAPFAVGNMLRIFGRNKFYLKNAETIEKFSKINTIIFDKTGTITTTSKSKITYNGISLSEDELRALKKILRESNHPLSRSLYQNIETTISQGTISDYEEILGKGISAKLDNYTFQLGSASFVNGLNNDDDKTAVYIKINSELKGVYFFKNTYRIGTKEVFESFSSKYNLVILSGDNDGEEHHLRKLLPENVQLEFNRKPEEKLDFVKNLQLKGNKVLMIGDGLNDAGALAQSTIGIVISDDINVFSPACDAILDASKFAILPKFLALSNRTISIIKASFVLSFCYNLIGMYFALRGELTPIVAAILMPLSSITIVVFVTFLTNWISRRI
jgi:Cu+-exporting ATPase